MYLRHTIRKKDGKVHRTWRLVRSVRVGRWRTSANSTSTAGSRLGRWLGI